MVHYTRVIQGLLNYIETEIAGKLAGGAKAWVVRVVTGLAASRAEQIFRMISGNPIVTALGLVDGESINIDAIMPELRKAARQDSATIAFPLIGPITFGLADIESLDRHIRGV